MENRKLTAHQCYVKSKEKNLTKEEYGKLLKDNGIIIGLRTSFEDMLNHKYPNILTGKIISLINAKYKEICPDNPILPLNCDLNKHLLIAVLDEYLQTQITHQPLADTGSDQNELRDKFRPLVKDMHGFVNETKVEKCVSVCLEYAASNPNNELLEKSIEMLGIELGYLEKTNKITRTNNEQDRIDDIKDLLSQYEQR